jgi:asparagine synthase (glutamine-hydrolysing)
MCGLCGVVRFGGLDSEATVGAAATTVEAMMRAMAHRGPDDAGVAADIQARLGFVRLAIRAPGDGRQPLVEPGGVIVVCNGEIDNHQELRAWLLERGMPVAGAADVAVIPALYRALGEAFIERLEGCFAVAVWDPARGQLLLGRDRAGERPLFFARSPEGVDFASELAALASGMAEPQPLAIASLHSWLERSWFMAPTTPFSGVEKVGPGEIVAIHADGLSRRRYWRWSPPGPPETTDPLTAFDTTFREAVRRQTEVDVAFGLFLSGGLDSALIAAVSRAVRPETRLRGYTLRFADPSCDEGAFAEHVADALGFDVSPVWVSPEQVPQALSDLIRVCNEPVLDPAWVPTALLARRAAADIRLALSGDGGDELFGGYPVYGFEAMARQQERLNPAMRALLRRAVERLPAGGKKTILSALGNPGKAEGADDPLTRHLALTVGLPAAVSERLGLRSPGLPAEDAGPEGVLSRLQRFDLEHGLAEGLMTKADRAGMAAALEIRCPFLDRAVMEFAAALPESERIHAGQTKLFLKRYALRYLPPEIVHRRKQGLMVPLAAWLRGPLRQWAGEQLEASRFSRLEICAEVPGQLLLEHERRLADHTRVLWALIVLSEWLDQTG